MHIGLLIKIPEGVMGCPKGNTIALRLLKDWLTAHNLWKSLTPPPQIGDELNNWVWLLESGHPRVCDRLHDLFVRLELTEFVAIAQGSKPREVIVRGEAIGDLDIEVFLGKLDE